MTACNTNRRVLRFLATSLTSTNRTPLATTRSPLLLIANSKTMDSGKIPKRTAPPRRHLNLYKMRPPSWSVKTHRRPTSRRSLQDPEPRHPRRGHPLGHRLSHYRQWPQSGSASNVTQACIWTRTCPSRCRSCRKTAREDLLLRRILYHRLGERAARAL